MQKFCTPTDQIPSRNSKSSQNINQQHSYLGNNGPSQLSNSNSCYLKHGRLLLSALLVRISSVLCSLSAGAFGDALGRLLTLPAAGLVGVPPDLTSVGTLLMPSVGLYGTPSAGLLGVPSDLASVGPWLMPSQSLRCL